MFTGLIEARGRIESVRRRGGVTVFTVRAPFAKELSRGDSVALNGVCLTVTRVAGPRFDVEAVRHTLFATTVGVLRPGASVNLERALSTGDRLGGHIVTGHVDGVGRVASIRRAEGDREIAIVLPERLTRYVAERGSIAVDGVSLTVIAPAGPRFSVALVAATLAATTLGDLRTGDRVNVEADLLAKHLEKLLAARGQGSEPDRLLALLEEAEGG